MSIAIDERRAERRFRVTLPVAIAGGTEGGSEPIERIGLSRDASASGVLFNTRSRFAAGDEIDLTLHLAADEERRVRARVVRVETVPKDSDFLWRYLTAVCFLEPLPDLVTKLAESTRPSAHFGPNDVA
jgi:hypothetical protein